MPLTIVRDDITNLAVDAWVNSANPLPVVGAGVDGAIYRAAGAGVLRERELIGEIAVGAVRITTGGESAARYIIHTVGPVWQGGSRGELRDLARCYRNALGLAALKKCASVALPLISTGVYGFPRDKALSVATETIGAFLQDHDMQVYLVVFDKMSFQISQDRFDSIQSFINDEYVEERYAPRVGMSPRRRPRARPRILK